MAELPLLRRFPALRTVPRAALGAFPTPVERVTLEHGGPLLIKRDDLSGAIAGGNKVRGLEWLLGGLRDGERVLTVGPLGSTHALLTAIYAKRLGGHCTVVRWNQELNGAARSVEARLRMECRVLDARFVPAAYALAGMLRVRGGGLRWVPAGGASPRAALGHVNAALELAEQIARGDCPRPARIVVPLGTGGTAAGLALGLRIAALDTPVVAVRVVPRIVGRARRVRRLANAAAVFIERASGERIPRVRPGDVTVEHAFYGGAYGRPLRDAGRGQAALRNAGILLDDTYSAKAFAAAAATRDPATLLWLTFDGRLLQD